MSSSRGGVCDARCQQFHREMTKKQEKIKTLWFVKNRQRLYENLGKERFSEKMKNIEHTMKRNKEDNVGIGKYRAEQVTEPSLPSWRPSKEDTGQMKPVKPDVENILYAAKDSSFTSKKNYLRERYKEKPEDRYFYPYCASWNFGWRLKDFQETRPSGYGVRAIIQASFYRKNASSLQRDPDWYRICQTGDPKNFNEIT